MNEQMIDTEFLLESRQNMFCDILLSRLGNVVICLSWEELNIIRRDM